MLVPAKSSPATRRLTLAVAASALVFAVLQVALGASPLLVVALVGVVIVTLMPVRVYGVSHIVGLLFLALCFYFGYNALLVPTLALRPADVGLFVPELSAAVVLAFAAAASLGALAARFLFPYLPQLVPPIERPDILHRIAVVALALGLVGAWLNAGGGSYTSAGAILSPYLYLAFTFEVAATLIETQRRRSISPLGFLMIVIIATATMMSNSKGGLFTAAGTWVAVNLIYGRRLSWQFLLPMAMLGVLLTYFFLSINLVRGYREDVTGLELVIMTVETTVELATGDPETLVELDAMLSINDSRNPLFYSVTYFEGLPVLVERFVMLPYADAILRSVSTDGPFAGNSFITRQLWDLLPAFLNPGKELTYAGNAIVISLGLGDQSFNGNPTIGLAAELFYAGGFATVVVGSAALFFLVSVLLSVAVGRVVGNPFGAFVLIRYVHFLVVGTSAGVAFFAVRQLPLDLVLVALMTAVLADRAARQWRPRGV